MAMIINKIIQVSWNDGNLGNVGMQGYNGKPGNGDKPGIAVKLGNDSKQGNDSKHVSNTGMKGMISKVMLCYKSCRVTHRKSLCYSGLRIYIE